MPRKRTISDETLLDAALDLIRADGPERLSFAALAAATGLAGSTLVQRFGSRPALLRAALERAWEALEARTADADEQAANGAAGVVDLFVALTAPYEAHDYADQLLVLREDLRDPVVRARGAAWLTRLAEAVDRRLPGHAAGAAVVAHWQGLVTVWGFTRTGRLDRAVAAGLTDLLDRIVGSDV